MASNEANHSSLITNGIFDILLRLSKSSEPDICDYSAFNLVNLASNADYLRIISEHDISKFIFNKRYS